MSITNEQKLKALKDLRMLFLVASKAFDVADILGKGDPKRDQMRALHNEAIAATDNLNETEDLDAIRTRIEELLIRMQDLAESNAAAAPPFASGGSRTHSDREYVIPERLRPSSTTNDEQAKYDAIIEKGVHIPELGTIANLADVQQPKERKPVLPILTTYDEHKSKYGMLGRELYFIDGWGKGADAYRTAMDELITTGKLRVVDEVECRELDLVEEWYSRPTKCLSCGVEFIMALPSGNYAPPNYCPGCGNKIKR